MKFDDLDLAIFNTFIEEGNDGFTSTYITKHIFNPQNRDELIRKNTQIDYRLKKWCANRLLIFNKINNIKQYILNTDIITIAESKLIINGIELDMGRAMTIELPDKTYLIKFLNEI